MKQFPLNKHIFISDDSMSFLNRNFDTETEILIGDHVGAFGTRRKNHRHEGVDLYCNPQDPVYAVEDGIVVFIEDFTGEKAGSPWWNNTRAVHVEGESGVIVYGEILETEGLVVGSPVCQGDLIGHVVTVLLKDKGRPMTMLHFELYEHGSRESVTWHPWEEEKPPFLKDPTSLLLKAMKDIQNGQR